MEKVGKLFIRHLLTQERETYIETWILRALLKKEHPNVTPETWDLVVKQIKQSPQANHVRELFDAEAAKVLQAFDDQVKHEGLKVRIAEEQQKLDEVMKQLSDVMSKLPPPKLPN